MHQVKDGPLMHQVKDGPLMHPLLTVLYMGDWKVVPQQQEQHFLLPDLSAAPQIKIIKCTFSPFSHILWIHH